MSPLKRIMGLSLSFLIIMGKFSFTFTNGTHFWCWLLTCYYPDHTLWSICLPQSYSLEHFFWEICFQKNNGKIHFHFYKWKILRNIFASQVGNLNLNYFSFSPAGRIIGFRIRILQHWQMRMGIVSPCLSCKNTENKFTFTFSFTDGPPLFTFFGAKLAI